MGLREAIRASSDRRFKVVDVPLLGQVRLRSLTHAEMRRLRNSFADSEGEIIRARWDRHQDLLAVESIVDDAGNPEFGESDALGGMFDALDGGAVKFLFREVAEHTGFLADKGWEAVESSAKN